MDHTIEARFVVKSDSVIGAPSVEDKVVAQMVQAVVGPDHGNFNVIMADAQCRFIYRAVIAMREALAGESGN